MTPIKPWRLAVIAAALVVASAGLPTAGAATRPTHSPAGTSTAAAGYLAAHPGGQVLNNNEVAYHHGTATLIVTVTRPIGPQLWPDCPYGWYCFYEYTNYGYPRGRLSDCGWQDLSWWGWQDRTESAYYNLNNGQTVFIHHTPGTSRAYDYRIFTISVLTRGIPDVAPYRDMADYVYRYC
jgi:hypothetical protein